MPPSNWFYWASLVLLAELVDFLRRELDRVGPSDAQRAREFFSRAVELEQLFFDESYTHPLP